MRASPFDAAIDANELASSAEGLSGAEIEAACREVRFGAATRRLRAHAAPQACMLALRDDLAAPRASTATLRDVLRTLPRSVRAESLREYEAFRAAREA